MNKKVSILSPCYNVEKYVGLFLDSIIAQNYRPLELILVNDGSTDNTESAIFTYKEKLLVNGIELKYLKKENGGQASAVAMGLQEVTGEYLIWPDSDDMLLEKSIQKRVYYMEQHPECGIVRSNGYSFKECEYLKPVSVVSKINRQTTIEDFMKFQVPWCSGCYMVRMSAFDLSNPQREIFLSKAGQNIQMILPVVMNYPCEYLDEYLYGYILHPTSHSHSIKSYEQQMEHLSNLAQCVEGTLGIIKKDTEKYLSMNQSFIRKMMYTHAWNYKRKKEQKEFEKVLRDNSEFDFEILLMKCFSPNTLIRFVIRFYKFIKRRFR